MLDKYTTLLALRVQREAFEGNGVFRLTGQAYDERRRMSRALAQAFPGALRELEYRDAAELRRCLDELAIEKARAQNMPDAHEPERAWIKAVLAYHATMRQAMDHRNYARARRIAAVGESSSPRDRRFVAWYGAAGKTEPGPKPSIGTARVTSLTARVCAEVARMMDVQPETVHQWVFGARKTSVVEATT